MLEYMDRHAFPSVCLIVTKMLLFTAFYMAISLQHF